MQAKIENDGTVLLRISPEEDPEMHAQYAQQIRGVEVLRYAGFDPSEPRDDDGKWTSPKVSISPKAVAKRPYPSMTSFPHYADTEEKRRRMEEVAPKELETWRKAVTARVSMGPSERLDFRKELDKTFADLKAAFTAAEGKKWNEPTAEKVVAAAKKKITKTVSPKVAKAVKAGATKDGRTKADRLASEVAEKLREVEEQWVTAAKKEANRLDKAPRDSWGRPTKKSSGGVPLDMEEQIRKMMGAASPHKLAKAMGIVERQKNVEQARNAIIQRIKNRVGSILRSVI